jgi:hypothetical protein
MPRSAVGADTFPMDENITFCELRLAAEGRIEVCPREACAFWEAGGAVFPGGCILDRVGTDIRRPHVAAYLLDVRERVEAARTEKGATR